MTIVIFAIHQYKSALGLTRVVETAHPHVDDMMLSMHTRVTMVFPDKPIMMIQSQVIAKKRNRKLKSCLLLWSPTTRIQRIPSNVSLYAERMICVCYHSSLHSSLILFTVYKRYMYFTQLLRKEEMEAQSASLIRISAEP